MSTDHFFPGPNNIKVTAPKNRTHTNSPPPLATLKPFDMCTTKNATNISTATNKEANLVWNPPKIAKPPKVSTKATIHANNIAAGIPTFVKNPAVPEIPAAKGPTANSFPIPCNKNTTPNPILNEISP